MAGNKQKKKRGRPPKHGGYSLLVKGELPENRKHIREYLTGVREGLILDLGPTEENLTAAQIILIDRVVTKLGVIRCIEEHIRENSVMRGHDLAPCLRSSYLAYNNSVRLDLQALGIDKQVRDREDLDGYLESNYGDKGKGNANQE
jgi:hypothetical protein